jgi:transposase-like protein
LEVFPGGGNGRGVEEDKAWMVAEIATSEDSICAVARRHGFARYIIDWHFALIAGDLGPHLSPEATGRCQSTKDRPQIG